VIDLQSSRVSPITAFGPYAFSTKFDDACLPHSLSSIRIGFSVSMSIILSPALGLQSMGFANTTYVFRPPIFAAFTDTGLTVVCTLMKVFWDVVSTIRTRFVFVHFESLQMGTVFKILECEVVS
jgi:hypothetical protein